jgi:chorismate mutase
LIALRGATTINENTANDIKDASVELFTELIRANNIDLSDIISIVFSCTDDVTKEYPGKFVREHFGINSAAIMHFNEMKVENSLPRCIRIMLLINRNTNDKIRFVYLREASNLRRDLNSNK